MKFLKKKQKRKINERKKKFSEREKKEKRKLLCNLSFEKECKRGTI